ncbi:MAG: response regulator [Anaerolineales bacterium]|nr:response regulator [Anaerolineales bacterium]
MGSARKSSRGCSKACAKMTLEHAEIPMKSYVVLTDLGMPEMTGWDVARAVRARHPRLPVVLLTGWGEHGTGETPPPGLVDRILAKPVAMNDLLAVIDDLTAGR